MKRVCPFLLCILLLSGCAPTVGQAGDTVTFFSMDTVMSVTVFDGASGAAAAVQAEVERLSGLLSRTDETSEISVLNRGAGTGQAAALSQDTHDVLSEALALWTRTGGAFDPAIAPVMDAWGFTKEEKQVPSEETLAALLPLTDASLLELSNDGAALPAAGMAVDLGGIAKGYAGDRSLDVLAEYGVTSALVSLGGNITALGAKPDGSAWRVAVKDPKDTEAYVGVLSVTDRTVATSGAYERYFEQDGVIYHHIIDPSTGYPARTGLLSVTIVSPSGSTADGLSTALFVLGEEAGLALWRASDDFEAVLVREDGTVLVTEGLADSFEFQGKSSGYTLEIVSR